MTQSEQYLPLQLWIGGDQLQHFINRNKDPKFLQFQEKIAARDHHSCRFCGFQAKHHFFSINLDGNYLNNQAANLATACPFCTQCQFLDGIGLPFFPGGLLVYAPEVSQAELNSLTHILFQSIYLEDDSASQSKNIYRTFRLRSQLVEKQLGEDLSKPAVYARMLIDADPEQAQKFNQKVTKSVRLLPDMVGFKPLIRSWQAVAFEELN